MAESFETTVYPVVVKLVNKVLKDVEIQAIAIVLAWYYWSNRTKELPASVWARCGVRSALAGRDLPGVIGDVTDVWRKMAHWQGAGMQNVLDKRPAPDKLAADRELFPMFMDDLTDLKRELAESFMDGTPALAVARGLNRSPARVSQMRLELAQKWADM